MRLVLKSQRVTRLKSQSIACRARDLHRLLLNAMKDAAAIGGNITLYTSTGNNPGPREAPMPGPNA